MERPINQRFKLLRKHLGLSQRDLSEQLGVVQATISAIEKDKQDVTPQTIELLHKKFDVSKYWLIDGKGEMFPTQAAEPAPVADWKDAAYEEVKTKNAFLEREVERLWQMISHLTGKPNFLRAFDHAGLKLLLHDNTERRSGAQMAA